MPTISATVIKHPRKHRRCDNCSYPIEGETVRLYGYADRGDTPFAVYLHRDCVHDKDSLRKLQAVEHLMQPTPSTQGDSASDVNSNSETNPPAVGG